MEQITFKMKIKIEGGDVNLRRHYKTLEFPMTEETFRETSRMLTAEKITFRDIESDLNIRLPYLDENISSRDLYQYCVKLQNLSKTLNTLSYYDEIVALVDCVTDSLEDLVRIVKKGNYHFYHNVDVNTAIENLCNFESDHMSDAEKQKELEHNNYFVSETGIIYLLEDTEENYEEDDNDSYNDDYNDYNDDYNAYNDDYNNGYHGCY